MIKNNGKNNYAFIDSQNLNLAIKDCGWILDFKRFYVYLKDKYKVDKIFLFIGYVAKNKNLYDFFKKVGFIVIFKPVLLNKGGAIKGNVDAELVLHTMIEYGQFNKAIIVSGDGDFYCLVDYLKKNNKLLKIGIPNRDKYSALLRGFYLFSFFVSNLRQRLEYKKREA